MANKKDTIDAELYLKMEQSPIFFIEQMWGLIPQPVKPEYKARFDLGLLMRDEYWKTFCKQVQPDWFEDFEEGKHMTWQQSIALYGVEKALRGEAPWRISIVSGHGIGKSMLLSLLILWFLFVHPDSQVACTSPGKEQMYDVLWKELAKWIDRLEEPWKSLYVWEAAHIRMKENPQAWFARAKTSSKENTEALAGVHADWVLMAVDEASGVEEPIFETMEGALTSGNNLVFLISNGTRSIGYFYDTHHKDAQRWQNYSFSSLESPRVDAEFVDGIIAKYGGDSVQFSIRVLGKFPNEGIMDDAGYVQMFSENDLHFVPFDPDWKPIGRGVSALDPSGEGQDMSAWAVRDRMRAGIMHEEKVIEGKTSQERAAAMALKSITLLDKMQIDPSDFVIDAFGVGHNVSQEIALATSQQKRPWRVHPVNTGEKCDDESEQLLYVNKRAEGYYKLRNWLRKGGELMDTPRLKEQILSIRFKRTPNGRIQIMDKVTMKKLGFPSPDSADALSMTFLRPDWATPSVWGQREKEALGQQDFDPHATAGD